MRTKILDFSNHHIHLLNGGKFARADAPYLFVEWIDEKIMNVGNFDCSFNNGYTTSNSGVDGSGGGGRRWGEGRGGGLGSSTGNVPDPTWSVSAFALEAAPHMQQQQQQQYTQNNPFINFYYAQQMTQPPTVDWLRGGGARVLEIPSIEGSK